jgi:Arc/MetJ-type ribon-helix-helix transcriptional regulator
MKTVTVRLPESLIAAIDAESRERRISKSDVVRERLEAGAGHAGSARSGRFERIADLVGSVDDQLPADLSARKKHYLTLTGYGRKRTR